MQLPDLLAECTSARFEFQRFPGELFEAVVLLKLYALRQVQKHSRSAALRPLGLLPHQEALGHGHLVQDLTAQASFLAGVCK